MVRNISNEGLEAQVKGEWATRITLKKTAINFDKRSSKNIRKTRSMEVRIKVINELLYLIWDVMILQNSRNEIVMDLPKSIFEIEKFHHNRALFHAGFVDDTCHVGCIFKRTRKLRHKTLVNTKFNIPVSG